MESGSPSAYLDYPPRNVRIFACIAFLLVRGSELLSPLVLLIVSIVQQRNMRVWSKDTMLSFPIESGAFRGDVTCRSKPLLQNGERFEIATEIHTLARFRATLTTPLHGVVFVNPMYPADPVHLNTLIYSRFLFSPTPHSQVLIRDTHGDFSFTPFVDTTVVSFLLPVGDYWIQSAASSTLHISTLLSSSWHAVSDPFLLSDSPHVVSLHPAADGFLSALVVETPISTPTSISLQPQTPFDKPHAWGNRPLQNNTDNTQFFFTDVSWELTVLREMKPRVPVLLGTQSAVMCDTSLPEGLTVDPGTGVVSGTPQTIASRPLYVLYVEGLQGRVEATVSISVHPPMPDNCLDDYRDVLVVLFVVVLLTLGWTLLTVLMRKPLKEKP